MHRDEAQQFRVGFTLVEVVMVIALASVIGLALVRFWEESGASSTKTAVRAALADSNDETGNKIPFSLVPQHILQKYCVKNPNKYADQDWESAKPFGTKHVGIKIDGKLYPIPIIEAEWSDSVGAQPGGEYRLMNGRPVIFINRRLSRIDQRSVLSHEIIHARQDAADGEFNNKFHSYKNPDKEQNRARREAEAYADQKNPFPERYIELLTKAANAVDAGNWELADEFAEQAANEFGDGPSPGNDIRLTIKEAVCNKERN